MVCLLRLALADTLLGNLSFSLSLALALALILSTGLFLGDSGRLF